MKEWYVPITIIEYGRIVTIKANTPAEARRLARRAEWVECSDAPYSKVIVSGKAQSGFPS